MESEQALLLRIGQRVARRRAALKLTLDDLAARSGVSRAMASRIERGEVHASAVVLDRLCQGLGLTLSELFAAAPASPLLRQADQPVWQDPVTHYVRREVAPMVDGAPARIVDVTLPAGAEVAFGPGGDRGVVQYVWLLDGTIEVTADGTRHRLAPGDCLHMRITGNTFRNPGPLPARYAVILVPEPLP